MMIGTKALRILIMAALLALAACGGAPTEEAAMSIPIWR
jgi:ABC-type glycerol-3-phosphate transport system substrate-binding protein